MLKIAVTDLRRRAKLSPNKVTKIETDGLVGPATPTALLAGPEAKGARFTDDGYPCPSSAPSEGAAE